MHLKTVNLLIGASIALVSSILTAIIANILQSRNDRQKRKWQVEDYNRKRRYEIEKERLAQAEEWAVSYVKFIDQTRSQFMILVGKLTDANEFHQKLREAVEAPKIHSYTKGILYRIDDKELLNFAGELDKFWIELNKLLSAESTEDNQNERKAFMWLLNTYFDDALKAHGKFMKRLDQIKAEISI